MGTIYAAEHLTLRRRVALKVLSDQLWGEQEMLERFRREAQVASLLAHEHIVSVFDLGVLPSGSAYYVMELLDGEDTSVTLAREGPLPWTRVRGIALQICDALAVAHARGVLHRDLKPANVFRVRGRADPDFVKLLDFGLVKVLGPARSNEQAGDLTGDGRFIGTLKFAPPEQLMGRPVDARIDIFSLGATIYRLLTGQLPYIGETVIQLLHAMQQRRFIPLSQWLPASRIPAGLPELLARALEPDRQQRLPDIGEFIRAIHDVHEPAEHAATQPRGSAAPTSDLVVSPAPHVQRRTLRDGRPLLIHTTYIGTRDHREQWSALARIDGLLPAALRLSHLGNSVRLTCTPHPGAGERVSFYADANRRETRCEHILLMDTSSPGSFDLGHRRSTVRRVTYAIGRRSPQALTATLADLGVQIVAPPELVLLTALAVHDEPTDTLHLECICAHP